MEVINNHIFYLFLGIYLSLSIYHFLVFLGRREDKINLWYSLLLINISLILFTKTIFPAFPFKDKIVHERMFNMFSMTFGPLITTPLTFFAYYSLNIKKFKIYLIIINIFAYLNIIYCYIIYSITWVYKNVLITLAPLMAFIAAFFLIIITAFFFKKENKKYKDKYLFALYFSIMSFTFFYVTNTIIRMLGGNLYIQMLFSNTGMILMAIIMANLITIQFNNEHRDLEELKNNLEKKVKERTLELKKEKDQKEKFFINLAHETKTPLTLISNYLDKYIKHSKPAEELDVIRNNIYKLKRDMVNFLDIEKLERNQVFYNHNQIINLSEIMKNKILLFKEIANQKKIKITSNLTDLIYIKIDPFAVDRILNNIIDNAINYSQKNGIIDISLESRGNSIIFTTKDNGIGISEKQLKNIFKPFYQISHEKRNIQGIGLGLNIVKKIIDEVNGEIDVTSKKNEGTIFEIKLDRYFLKENDKVNENIKISQPMKRFSRINKTNNKTIEKLKNILVVEDNIDMLNYLQTSLNETFNVYTAKNGEQALATLKNIEKLDTIISDIMMDEMDGYEFYNQLLKNEYYKHIPFIFLTAKTSSKEKVFSLKKGAIDFITKPFNIDELIAKINSIIKVQDALTEYSLNKLGKNLYNILENINQLKNQKLNIKSLRNNEEDIIQRIYTEYGISRREIEIISLLKNGLEHKEIADKLGISIYTVRSFIRRIYKKCRVNNKIDLLHLLRSKEKV